MASAIAVDATDGRRDLRTAMHPFVQNPCPRFEPSRGGSATRSGETLRKERTP
jgi:hypothetical protein